MNNQDYQCRFVVNESPREVFDAIRRVSEWWTVNTEGSTNQVNDTFIVRFGETRVDFSVTEMVPGKNIVWLVTDCNLHWLADKKEWKGTSLHFNIRETEKGTEMTMIHRGLAPEIECYNDCKKGWDFYAGESLRKLITEKKGQPDASKEVREAAAKA